MKSLEEKAKSQYRYKRLYRNLYNPEFYLLAYKNIASSQGSMTTGADRMTLDAMSMARINRIIKDYSYQPNPARRVYIAKKNSNKKRPLGILSTDDKLVQEIVRMILEAIYEPTFSNHSHGFRPYRSCHTALEEVQIIFSGAKWVVEGDIHACFDSFDHHVLINILRRRIHDEHFISLMWKLLKAGYMEQWQFNKTYSGTPQGSGISPILANIYLSELDTFIEDYKQMFDKGDSKQRALNREYSSLEGKYMYLSRKFKKIKPQLSIKEQAEISKQLRIIQKKKLATPYYPPKEPGFKRIQYNRYADDFLIGVIGSKEDAQQVKTDIKQFLQEKLNLIMSEEKTKITHSSELIRYLGYNLTVSRDRSFIRNMKGNLLRMHYGKVQLYLPKEKWVDKLREYKAFKIKKDENGNETWKALHRGILMGKSEVEIISKYNVEIRGIYNFYRLAKNVSILNKFRGIMESSMLKTFAAKYSSSIRKVKADRMKNGIFGVYYMTKSGVKRCEFHNERMVKKSIAAPSLTDILPQYRKYNAPNSFAARLLGGECELCSAKSRNIKMHHIKSLKSLKGSRTSEILMMEKHRKSLALCEDCFEKVNAGLL